MAKTPAANRRIVGMALLASAGVMGFIALLFGVGVISVPAETQFIVAIALGAAALVDALIGLRFLLTASG
jgi:hypothetical protein